MQKCSKLIIMTVFLQCLFFGGVFAMPEIADAQRVECSPGYVLETDSICITRSQLHCVDVYSTKDGRNTKFQYCFEWYKGIWYYQLNAVNDAFDFMDNRGFNPVSSNKLANDILYTVLKVKGR